MSVLISNFAVMNMSNSHISKHCLAISLLCTVFITYPNVMWIPWNISNLSSSDELQFWSTFVFRCIFFFITLYCQIKINLCYISADRFFMRFLKNFLFTLVAGVIFIVISTIVPILGIQSGTIGKHLTFQFLVVCLLCTFIGYIAEMNTSRYKKEQEIERLKIENLKSQCSALTKQINPHFFFNSLNGISSLVQHGDEEMTLDYIGRLSDIFRYTLQSDRKQLVSLDEEIHFVKSFAYVMEVRYKGKLDFNIDIPDNKIGLKLPVLSLLPLLENVTVHNRIDSDHRMTVNITRKDNTLIVENKVSPKLTPPDSNGTGLDNLNKRFQLMTGNSIKIENDQEFFRVYLPLSQA